MQHPQEDTNNQFKNGKSLKLVYAQTINKTRSNNVSYPKKTLEMGGVCLDVNPTNKHNTCINKTYFIKSNKISDIANPIPENIHSTLDKS